MTGDRIPVYAPALGASERENLEQCLSTGALIHGHFVHRFEEEIAAVAGRRHAVGTNSGTAAIHRALLASGIGVGDEVFVTTLSFIAPANAITTSGPDRSTSTPRPARWSPPYCSASSTSDAPGTARA